jgi:hypothetical protein
VDRVLAAAGAVLGVALTEVQEQVTLRISRDPGAAAATFTDPGLSG